MEDNMFGRIQLYIIAGILIFSAMTAFYYNWRKGIEREALLEYNQNQIEQSIKDQEILKQQIEDISAKKAEIEADNIAEKKTFNDKLQLITNNLNLKSVTDTDRPSSKILKDTVSKLKDVVK